VRYHARTADDVPVEASWWLEEFRLDLLTYFGVLDSQRNSVVDYYRFHDDADFARNSPCPARCTEGTAVYSTRPLDEYELVHGFLGPIGNPPPYLIAEGTAPSVQCYPQDAVHVDEVSNWSDLVSEDKHNAQVVYGQMVVQYLLETYGPQKFIQYYRDAHFTHDPGLFALEFERSFGTTFTSIWNDALRAKVPRPVCPCTLEPLPLNTTFDPEHPNSMVYRPLIIPDGTSLLLTLPPGNGPMLKECANQSVSVRLAGALNGTNLAVMKNVESSYLSFGVSERATTAVGDWISENCAAAGAISISADTIGLTIVATVSGALYLNLSVEGSRQIMLRNASTPTIDSVVELCGDCARSGCLTVGAVPMMVDGSSVLVVTPPAGGLPGTGRAVVHLLFE
jgi:hypothetical protein